MFRLVITQPGGRVGDLAQRVDGLAGFTPGEEVLVFLERRGESTYHVRGMGQGKYRVERPGDGRVAQAVPEPLGDTLLIDPASGQPTPQRPRALSLEALKGQVRQALASPRPRQDAR